ncbi:MAG: molecular chaperone DnaK [Candidatus Sumerlaeota bacterium]|nr:molecular chaperone DnaK [Candidatus Sumerlaeota bacterium]
MGHVVGIDLGTTNSVVAFVENGQSEVIANAEGFKTTPSAVFYPEDGSEPVVGEMAKRQSILQPGRVVRSIKRFMGARMNEAGDRILHCPYKIVSDADDRIEVAIDNRRLTPEEVSSEVLKKMIRTAEDFLGEEIEQAVITVPAYFNDSQRTATKKAGELAGVEVIRIINEPTAAALAYGLKREASESVAVFDFGGGTFDISILEIDNDVYEVRSTNGDTFLGGDNIDQALSVYLCDAIRNETGVDPRGFVESLSRIHDAAERAKCELSTLPSTLISLPFIVADAGGPKHFNKDLKREEFEQLIDPILQRLIPPCRQAMNDARVQPNDLGNVLLVGGSTRIPAVRRIVKQIFEKDPVHSVNPDEAVAIGASIQAAVLTGALAEVLLLDVTPLSLGIELQGGIFSPLIPRNSTIPTSATKTFTTVRDNQRSVTVHVLQGERRVAEQNRTLERFRLEEIDPAPREIPQIDVAFSIDANGILSVSARDLASGKAKEVTIESYSGSVSADEVERIVHQAEKEVDKDRDFIGIARIKARAERITETARNYLTRSEEKMTEEEARIFRERLFRMDLAMTGTDAAAIESAEADMRQLAEMFSDLVFMDRLL